MKSSRRKFNGKKSKVKSQLGKLTSLARSTCICNTAYISSSSSICRQEITLTFFQESPEFGKQFFAPVDYEACDYAAKILTSNLNNSLRETFLDILNKVDLSINIQIVFAQIAQCYL